MPENQHRDTRRQAFTVLELLIVTAIIALLIGLLVPALVVARESARCIQCKSNLREIGVAIQLYHNEANRLPEAWNTTSDKSSGYGWAVSLLPNLEEFNLRSRIDCNLPVAAIENEAPRNTDLRVMRCPSDISEPTFELLVEQSQAHDVSTAAAAIKSPKSETNLLVRLPAANYLGVFGTLEADETFPSPAGDGAIVSDRVVRYSDLERGQSHTIIIGERTAAMAPSTWYGVNFRGEDAACRLVGSAITSPNCTTCDECEFASRHSGGSNFVWADGHVTLLASNIDTHEYQRLAKRRAN